MKEPFVSENALRCPHCGGIEKNPWDFDWRGQECVQWCCGHCGELFDVSCERSVTYTSPPMSTKR